MTEEQLRQRFPRASEDFIRANASNLDARTVPEAPKAVMHRLRQRSGPKLNKTEQAFLEYLNARYDPKDIRAQAVTLVIGNGVRYTVDFTNLRAGLAWETKGHMRDDAAVKLKVAAAQYPEIKFHLVTRAKGAGWAIQEILP